MSFFSRYVHIVRIDLLCKTPKGPVFLHCQFASFLLTDTADSTPLGRFICQTSSELMKAMRIWTLPTPLRYTGESSIWWEGSSAAPINVKPSVKMHQNICFLTVHISPNSSWSGQWWVSRWRSPPLWHMPDSWLFIVIQMQKSRIASADFNFDDSPPRSSSNNQPNVAVLRKLFFWWCHLSHLAWLDWLLSFLSSIPAGLHVWIPYWLLLAMSLLCIVICCVNRFDLHALQDTFRF